MATAKLPVRRRRTQAERREETRTALLDATIECLVEFGYAKTTTGRIADLAGVSRGAQIPYFRTGRSSSAPPSPTSPSGASRTSTSASPPGRSRSRRAST